ncbi:MAG: hypothetical protein F6K11_05885 [Leptolyngbya sp. SIO3F4]|nr:hypothetical protein [Leptolyngbya sp. SIO3F4]
MNLHHLYRKVFLAGSTAACVLWLGTSCGSTASDSEATPDTDNAQPAPQVVEAQSRKVGELFEQAPTPVEMSQWIKRAGIPFNQALLHRPEAARDYLTYSERAVSLGAYGADLVYLSLYQQTQQAVDHFSAVNELTSKLSLQEVFDEETMDRWEVQWSEPDSMQQLISEKYRLVYEELEANESPETSILVLFGGWLQSTYISIHSVDELALMNDYGEAMEKQLRTADKLLELCTLFPENPQVVQVENYLQELRPQWKKLESAIEQTHEETTPEHIEEMSRLAEEVAKTTYRIRSEYL